MDEKTKEKMKTWEQEFSASVTLQSEFAGDLRAYVAFKLAEAQGRVQISRSKICEPITAEQFHAGVRVEELKEKIAANESELERLSGLQKKSAENEAQYANGVPCTP